MNAFERDGADLIVSYGEPDSASADQIAVDADWIQERYDRGVFDHTESAPLKVKDLEAKQFGEEQPWIGPLF
jgi:hypothetical protein